MSLTLTYPFSSPTLTVILRADEFGDVESNDYNTIIRETRGGDLKVKKDQFWPNKITKVFNTQALSTTQASSFETFLNTANGKEIGLLDTVGQRWQGYIITPVNDIIEAGRGCNFAIAFQFRGKIVGTVSNILRAVVDVLDLSDTPTVNKDHLEEVADTLNMNSYSNETGVITKKVSDNLAIDDPPTVSGVITKDVSDTINLGDAPGGIV